MSDQNSNLHSLSTSAKWIPTRPPYYYAQSTPTYTLGPRENSLATKDPIYNNSTRTTNTPPNTGSPAVSITTKPTSSSALSNKVSSGVFAGVAVACLIGGALIAALLTWWMMSSRHKKQNWSHGGGFEGERRRKSRHSSGDKAVPAVLLVSIDPSSRWESHLDQPESDGTIQQKVKGILDHIEVHVENFYRDRMMQIGPQLHNQLMGVDSRHLPSSVTELMPQTGTPTMLIKHCIAQNIIAHISTDSPEVESFLPTDLVALPQLLAANSTNKNKPAYDQALSRWRVLSVYLRPQTKDDQVYVARRDTNIANAAEALCRAFDPWALTKDNFDARFQNLINIKKTAADVGLMLFAQPGTFVWHWKIPSDREKHVGRLRLVLPPGLDKVRDENAKELQRAQDLVKPVTGVVQG